MIAELLTPVAAYLPLLEKLGLQFLEVVEYEGVPHSVFRAPDGTRFLYPGVRGSPDEMPMIPARKVPELIKAAKEHLKGSLDP